ncbi:plasma kallikrein-like [Denticeps clupeoides]|uniref:plasma kallikrein-like n=1 Tax=Denticeps clupeoides TaxID=299321 RepID=UPI0010A53495|nr:plasma kallikrein-like [Denticeps clupeoides]
MWISQLLLLLVCIRTELSDGQACDRSLFIDTDFPGKDFKQIITSSAQECQLACTLNELCVTFSYLTPQWTTDSRTNFCYLKNTSPSSNTLLNIISGKTLKFCDGVVSDPPKTYTVVSTQMSWTSALSICRTQFTDLATIYSENDWSQLLQTPGVTKGLWKCTWN